MVLAILTNCPETSATATCNPLPELLLIFVVTVSSSPPSVRGFLAEGPSVESRGGDDDDDGSAAGGPPSFGLGLN